LALRFCDVENVFLEGPRLTRSVGPVSRHHDMASRAGHGPAAFTHHAENAARHGSLDQVYPFGRVDPDRLTVGQFPCCAGIIDLAAPSVN
jgi:hypothetical protein